jgi:hypothetical protein
MSTESNVEMAKKVLASGLDVEEYLTDDAVWTIPGFGIYKGKEEISTKLLEPMHGLMESMGNSVITNIVAQEDCVVVESYAENRITKTGKPYNNTYCHVYQFADGQINHVTEYADTALAKSVFTS